MLLAFLRQNTKSLLILTIILVACATILATILFITSGKAQKNEHEKNPQQKNVLNVHIVAHSHDDVGWVKTINQYYNDQVQYILSSVIAALLNDPTKRFIYVESAFFFKWWRQQSTSMQKQVKQLVDEERLEFIGGAWSMNDEATTHYQSIIDQFTWGLRQLNDTFGDSGRPKIAWQIDPFGHSSEFASLLAQMGYDGLFLGRIDYEDLAKRFSNRNTEMIWQPSKSLGSKINLFTSILSNGYYPPPGFCFDRLCAHEPITDANVDRKADELINYSISVQQKYRSNHILLTFGGDFHYQEADKSFKNLDKLILHINMRQRNGSMVKIFYSTPSRYLKAVHHSNISFDTKSDDFFPYASDGHSFWTGFFTSRPSLKRFERIGNHYFQICKQLTVFFSHKTSKFEESLDNLREIMGVMQHHDAVTGTEKQYVAEDYARLLQIGIDKCSENIKEALNQLSHSKNQYVFDYKSCADLNISACEITENSNQFMITLYNPLAHSTIQYVRLPVETGGEYEIRDSQNVAMSQQLVPIPIEIQLLSYRRSKAKMEVVFLADEIPPLGYKSYFVEKKARNSHSAIAHIDYNEPGKPFTIGDRKHLQLTFDQNGLLTSAACETVEMNVRQNFYIYEGYAGPNIGPKYRSSGAYVFRPKTTNALNIGDQAKVIVIRGELVDEVHQTFNDWLSQVIRIYKNENKAEFQWLVGPIPTDDYTGREIITRFDTDIASNGIFHTDSNRREMMQRRRNHRDTWNLTLLEPVSGNYYPVTTKIAIEDETRRFALLTDRAHGGSSLTDGSIELMIHRRLLHDDAFGVGEALNEKAYGKGLIVRGSINFVFGPKKHSENVSTEANERFVQLQIHLPSWPLFSDVNNMSYDTWQNNYNHIFSGLSQSLPKNVHLLTFEPWTLNSTLIRFEHIFAKDEDQTYSRSVSIDVQQIFQRIGIVSMHETTLSANQWLNQAKRLNFTAFDTNGVCHTEFNKNELNGASNFKITLNPMEIRTFIIKF